MKKLSSVLMVFTWVFLIAFFVFDLLILIEDKRATGILGAFIRWDKQSDKARIYVICGAISLGAFVVMALRLFGYL